MATNDEEYGKPVPKTWAEAVKAAGSEEKAAVQYPTLNPVYQKDVKEYGEGKGIEKYSQDVVDPATIDKDEGTWAGAFDINNPQEGFNEYSQGLKDLKKDGAAGNVIADVGGVLEKGGEAIANLGPTVLGGAPVVTDPNAAAAAPGKGTGGGGGGKAATPPATNAGAQAADSMLQALAGEYTGEMNALAPYMSGQAGTTAAAYAQGLGQSIGGSGVQAQNPAYAAALAGPQNNVAKAAQAGSTDIAQGLRDVGQADAAYITVSPYAGLLQALQSEGQYKVETGATTPNVKGTPAWAQAAYADVLGQQPSGTTAATAQPQLAASQATTPSTNTTSSPGAAGGSA